MKEHKVLGLQYYGDEMVDYHRVVDIAKEENLSLSKTGKLLINKGLIHKDNPEPLVKVKEKVVYKDRPPITKVVYRDRPNEHIVEHLSDIKVDQANDKEQPASVDKLRTPNEAKSGLPSSKLALEEEKSTKGEKIAEWIGGGILASIIVGGLLYKWLGTPK